MHKQDFAKHIYEVMRKTNHGIPDLSQALVLQFINTLIQQMQFDIVRDGKTINIRGFGQIRPKAYRVSTKSGVFREAIVSSEADPEQVGTHFIRPVFKSGQTLEALLNPDNEQIMNHVRSAKTRAKLTGVPEELWPEAPRRGRPRVIYDFRPVTPKYQRIEDMDEISRHATEAAAMMLKRQFGEEPKLPPDPYAKGRK